MPKLTPEQHAFNGIDRRIKSIDARIEILKAERAALVKLKQEMQPDGAK